MEGKTQALTYEVSTIVERVARIVSSVRGTNPDYAHLAAELEPAIPFDLFGIVLLRHDRQAVRVTICTCEGETWRAHYHQHPLEGSKLQQLLRSLPSPLVVEPPLCIQDYPNGVDGPPIESGDALSGSPHLHATLIAPLVVGEHVLGTLELGSSKPGAYTDETLQRLISSVVRVLAAAIERTQLGGSVEIQDRQREALKHVSNALTTEMDLSSILTRIVVGIAEALQVASAIVTFDVLKDRLRLEAQCGLDSELLSMLVGRKLALSERSILGATFRHRQPYVSQDIGADERFPESRLIASVLDVHSLFSYPLIIGEQVYGTLLLFSPEPGGFTPLKADILSLFAGQATIAIHNGMLLESARKRKRFQEAIEQIERETILKAESQHGSSDTSSSEEERALFDRVRQETEQTFGIRFSSLLRFFSDHLLTQNERNLQAFFEAKYEKNTSTLEPGGPGSSVPVLPEWALDFKNTWHENYDSTIDQQEESTALLLQMAEAALTRAGLFGNVSAALISAHPQLYERITHDMADAWFLVDLAGHCLYINPSAEALCGVRMDASLGNIGIYFNHSLHTARLDRNSSGAGSISSDTPKHSSTGGFVPALEEVFADLLSRARNADELYSFLGGFKQTNLEFDEENDALAAEASPTSIRCVLAAEPLQFKDPSYVAVKSSPFNASNIRTGTLSNGFTLDSFVRAKNAKHHTPISVPSDHHYQLTRSPLSDKNGRLVAHALQVHDITEQVRDEKNKSVLLSSVSHDLRTPLTTIKAAVTGLLQPGVEWDEQMRREILEEIDAETDHLGILVNALVEMSRIEMGALVLEKEWCDIVELVHGTISRLDRILGGRRVRTRIQSQLPLVQADYVQVERVFRNLLENAVKHSPERSDILITLGVDHGMLRAQVIDQGSGVPEEERERIFKTFYSLDAQGSGLGLAICRGIIEAHGGRIWVEPALEGNLTDLRGDNIDDRQRKQTGSCFVFVLPLHS